MAKHTAHMEHLSDWLDMKMGIGRAIKMKRVLSGLTHKQLAHEVRLPHETLCAYETGKKDIPLEHLHRITLALGVNMYALIPETFY